MVNVVEIFGFKMAEEHKWKQLLTSLCRRQEKIIEQSVEQLFFPRIAKKSVVVTKIQFYLRGPYWTRKLFNMSNYVKDVKRTKLVYIIEAPSINKELNESDAVSPKRKVIALTHIIILQHSYTLCIPSLLRWHVHCAMLSVSVCLYTNNHTNPVTLNMTRTPLIRPSFHT